MLIVSGKFSYLLNFGHAVKSITLVIEVVMGYGLKCQLVMHRKAGVHRKTKLSTGTQREEKMRRVSRRV